MERKKREVLREVCAMRSERSMQRGLMLGLVTFVTVGEAALMTNDNCRGMKTSVKIKAAIEIKVQ